VEDVMATNNKMRELVLYIAKKSEKDPYFGSIKLNKILFYSDFAYYAKTGNSITGAEYRKYKRGPAPAIMKSLKEEMESDKIAYERNVTITPTHMQKRMLAGREPDMTAFTDAEVATIDFYIEELWGMTATDVSFESHRFPGWKHAELSEEIPYFTAFLSETPLTPSPSTMEWAKARAERYVEENPIQSS
jgi:Antitoxin SocA-like, Panacea domain